MFHQAIYFANGYLKIVLILTQEYIFILERVERRVKGRERQEREREAVASYSHPTKDRTLNLGMCPDQELNLQPFWCTRML